MIYEFPQSVIENLGFYVYLLIDPADNKIFYVGRGVGNRIFDHIHEANEGLRSTEKLDKIRSIISRGEHVKCFIHRHGLNEKEASEVESSLIDFIEVRNLSNEIKGLHSSIRGHMSVEQINLRYNAPMIEIAEAVILITINNLYYYGMNEDLLYESTRKSWKAAPHRHKPKYAFAVFRGIVRQAYEIESWYRPEDNPGRYAFNGKVAQEMQHYIGKSIAQYIKPGAQNPIKYVNC